MGRSAPRLRCKFSGSAVWVFILAVHVLVAGSEQGRADPAEKNLQLEVFVNGAPAHMISSFVQFSDGTIGAAASEIEELGLRAPRGRAGGDVVRLDQIPTLKYQYVERSQKILITIADADRIPRAFDLREGSPAKAPRAQAGWGAVLNYDLLAASGSFAQWQPLRPSETSLKFDARAFSPYGTLSQSALLISGQGLSSEATRLDTAYRYSDQDRLVSYSLGDAINGGLAWTRPIRIGGAQAQSNFALRPDLVTMPLPSLGGTAAVPSSVDVYVNNIKTFSQDVGTGPFSVSNIPLITGAGNAQLVVRDASGQETRTVLPFYASTSLLAPGLTGWSVEGGLPRLAYGSTADTYVETPVASGTLRRGIFDWLTVEGHAEGGSGVINGGAGAALRTGTLGVAEAAVSASEFAGRGGWQTYASYETRLFGLNINASSQRALGAYNDLASATARLQAFAAFPQPYLNGFFNFAPYIHANAVWAPFYASLLPPRAADRVSVGAPVPFDAKASWNLSFLHQLDAANNLSNILAASYSRALPAGASLFATVFNDFGTVKNAGVVVGLSIPLGDSVSLTSSASRGQGGTTATVDAVKSLGPAAGDVGWEVRDAEGAAGYRSASLSYRTGYLTAKVGASQDNGGSSAGLELRGSIATMGGDVFFSDWIDDGFAVVNAGAPGVEVSYENRPLGNTDAHGMLLVPSLRSYQKNTISVDPANIPVDREIETTREVVAPRDRAGVLVEFKVHDDSHAALVAFVRADASAVPVAASGKVDGGEDFVVGYDGEAFIKGLAGTNSVTITFADTSCRASFDFTPQPGQQTRIGPITCR